MILGMRPSSQGFHLYIMCKSAEGDECSCPSRCHGARAVISKAGEKTTTMILTESIITTFSTPPLQIFEQQLKGLVLLIVSHHFECLYEFHQESIMTNFHGKCWRLPVIAPLNVFIQISIQFQVCESYSRASLCPKKPKHSGKRPKRNTSHSKFSQFDF